MFSDAKISTLTKNNIMSNAAIIGAGNVKRCRCNRLACICEQRPNLQNPQDFYTIDTNANSNPDLIYNITCSLPINFKNRFKLTILEATSEFNLLDLEFTDTEAFLSGFKNIVNMTADDGFIFLVGCPRDLKFRSSFKNLKYIEYNDSETNKDEFECVLIPKNQQLTIEQIKRAILQYPLLLNTLLYYHQKNPTENIEFCRIAFRDLSSPYLEIGFHANLKNSIKELKIAIDLLAKRGREIQDPESKDGDKVVALASDLHSKLNNFLNSYINNPSTLINDYCVFKDDFVSVLNNSIITNHRYWEPIVSKIFSALTGVRALLLAVQLIYSKVTISKFAFFARNQRGLFHANSSSAMF